jgi:group I intron endonuclease
MHYLYRITDTLSNKIYIGQSNKEIERWRQHKYYARQEEPIQYISRAMKKYGVENFTYEVIACCRTQEDADELETQLIKQYDSQNKEHGYNIAPGGEHAWNAGLPSEQQPMYGKRQSEYFKKRMSEVHTGKVVIITEETKQKISDAMIGREITWGDKISAAQIGKIVSEETKEKQSQAAKVKVFTDEHKNNISDSLRGISKGPQSEEHKKNLSLAHLGNTHPLEIKDKMSGTHRKLLEDGKCHTAKLTWELVRQIRAEYAVGNIFQSELAKKYSMSENAIGRLLRNITWKE